MYLRGKIWYSDYYDENGRRYRLSLHTESESIARMREARLTNYIRIHRVERKEILLWADFKRWYMRYIKTNMSVGTQYIHKLAIRRLEEYKAPYFLREITPELFLALIAFLQRNGKAGPAGRNRVLTALKSMMNTAEDFGKIGISQRWKLVKKDPSESDGRIEWHTVEELKALRGILEGDLLTAFYLGWEEGLRRGEIAYLQKTDYDPINHTISIQKRSNWKPKTKKSARIVPLRPESEKAIQASIRNAPADSPFVINIDGKRETAGYLSVDYIKKAQQELPHIHCFLHKLRHTFGSLLVQAGQPIKVVSDLMGHSNILQTEKYVHIPQKQFVAALESLPSIAHSK